MVKLEQWHIVEYREPTQETAHDWEQEVVFADMGRRYRVTVYSCSDYGPAVATYAIEDDETGATLYDSRVEGRDWPERVRVNVALIGELARDLHKATHKS